MLIRLLDIAYPGREFRRPRIWKEVEIRDTVANTKQTVADTAANVQEKVADSAAQVQEYIVNGSSTDDSSMMLLAAVVVLAVIGVCLWLAWSYRKHSPVSLNS